MEAFEECLQATSSQACAVVLRSRGDDKDNARLIVSRIVVDALEGVEDVVSEDESGETAGGVAGDSEGAGGVRRAWLSPTVGRV